MIELTAKSLARPQLELPEVVETALKHAKNHGVSAAKASAKQSEGYSLSVRLGELENVKHNNSKSLSITVYMGNKSGSSTTNDLDSTAIADTVRAACTIAKFTAEDPCNGLPPKDRLVREFPDLEKFNPWNIEKEEALESTLACESSAMSFDSKIVNSEGANLHTSTSEVAFGNTDDLLIHNHSTAHSMDCCVVGASESGMQRDYWYSSTVDPQLLESPRLIGELAAKRTLRRLDARQLDTCEAPVLFEAPVAASLLSHLVSAISGTALYRQASFLLDSVGKSVFPEMIRIHEQPHLKRTIGSAYCDAEGVATKSKDIVRDGVLQAYVLSSYSARKLGLETTGNAGGTFNLTIDPGGRDFNEMLKLMHTGLLVTELIGFGVNTVTGDYSRGASGFWIENGEIQYPVEQLTIAGNLKDMFHSIVEVGKDVDLRRSTRTGSILISNMAIAGQ